MSLHKPSCPASMDPDVTCVCLEVRSLLAPFVSEDEAIRRWGTAGLLARIWTGKLRPKTRIIHYWIEGP